MLRSIPKYLVVSLYAGLIGILGSPAHSSTLEEVRKRNVLTCGVSEGLVGFSSKVGFSGWAGFDVDFCRAVAAAVLGNSGKVELVPSSAGNRFKMLASGKIDLLVRNTTWTLSRETMFGLDFVGVTYFDGQGFLVRKASGIKSVNGLIGKTVCFLANTTIESNVNDFFEKRKIKATLLSAKSRVAVRSSYENKHCHAYASDVSALVSERTQLRNPSAHRYLPELIAKEPLGPVVRDSDPHWRDVIQAVLFVLINAEEVGWTSKIAGIANLPAKITVPSHVTRKLRLSNNWPRSVIAQVGNYGEIFERNIGAKSALKIPRRLNKLWLHGGLLYAPPIR